MGHRNDKLLVLSKFFTYTIFIALFNLLIGKSLIIEFEGKINKFESLANIKVEFDKMKKILFYLFHTHSQYLLWVAFHELSLGFAHLK